MEHIQEIRVLYSDTDSYGVVWHGAYTKWFEAARVEYCEKIGLDIAELESKNIVFPVVELNIRYKSSALMNERIVIKTVISELTTLRVTFEHKVYKKDTDILRVIAHSTIVSVNGKEKKMMKLPENLYKAFANSIEK
jgi:acyl-CoA thioester hydrolase